MNLERIKARWNGKECKLNGKPARVLGSRLPFARVVEICKPLHKTKTMNVTWMTAHTIMLGNRQFDERHRAD